MGLIFFYSYSRLHCSDMAQVAAGDLGFGVELVVDVAVVLPRQIHCPGCVRLNQTLSEATILLSTSSPGGNMPQYEFLCHDCRKLFSKILSLVDYEEDGGHVPEVG
jgi:hypothetical protein